MLNWAFVFLVVALVAALLAFGGLVPDSAPIARSVFAVFSILFLVSLLTSLVARVES